MKLDVWCSRKPYIEHSAPVWHALPDEYRGRYQVADNLIDVARDYGIEPQPYEVNDRLLLILSRAELPHTPERRYIFIEHGAGTSYKKRSHLGLITRKKGVNDAFELVLTTPPHFESHDALFKGRVKVVGCPKLDTLPSHEKTDGNTVVAFSHHWNQQSIPETMSAWPWTAPEWERIARLGKYRLIAHKHPGDTRDIETWAQSAGIEFVADFRDVLRRADIYVADNTSTLYEFASTDRPVVCVSPPWYRRDRDWGMRFWDNMPGIDCGVLSHLEACIDEAIIDTDSRKAQRRKAVAACYGPTDGHATARAVDAIVELLAT